MSGLRPVQRLAAYAVLHPEAGSDDVLLVQASRRSDLAGRWFLPGGGVDHGEDPADATVREVAEETGLRVRVTGVREVLDDVLDLPHRGVQVHTVRVVHDVEVVGRGAPTETDGTGEAVRRVSRSEAAALPLAPYVARALGLPERPLGELRPDLSALQPISGAPGAAPRHVEQAGGEVAVQRLRVGVYGLALRRLAGVEQVLLTLIADTAAGAGLWTLPGGGLDHGEAVGHALAREVHEETGLHVRRSRLLGVDSVHFTGRAPHGPLEDFHGVRVVHAVDVDRAHEAEPVVVEVGGSTAAVRWVPLEELATVPLTRLVPRALDLLGHPAARTVAR